MFCHPVCWTWLGNPGSGEQEKATVRYVLNTVGLKACDPPPRCKVQRFDLSVLTQKKDLKVLSRWTKPLFLPYIVQRIGNGFKILSACCKQDRVALALRVLVVGADTARCLALRDIPLTMNPACRGIAATIVDTHVFSCQFAYHAGCLRSVVVDAECFGSSSGDSFQCKCFRYRRAQLRLLRSCYLPHLAHAALPINVL